jgi:hypothetical protein
VLCISEDQHVEITDNKAYWIGDDCAPDAELSGGSARASTRGNAEQGVLRPAFTLPSGQHRWDLDDVRRQLRDLQQRGEDD